MGRAGEGEEPERRRVRGPVEEGDGRYFGVEGVIIGY